LHTIAQEWEGYHMMVMSRESSRSGIVGGIWADQVVEVNRRNPRTKGYVFSQRDELGRQESGTSKTSSSTALRS
jgi:hypothetical protein